MKFAVILVLLTSFLVRTETSAAAQDRTLVPQARPVLVWLSAVKAGNQDALKTAFSESMRRQFDQAGWATVLTTYQGVFRKAFGDYALDDFAFDFTGGAESGQVIIVHKGNRLPGVQVIREGTDWKVNER